jgi:hypothetical protein
MNRFITGEKFKSIADYIYTPSVKYEHDYNDFGNTFHPLYIKDGDIIYTHTMFVKQLFLVVRNIDKKLTIVSHNCDTAVDSSFIIPANVVKWYSQNVNITDPRVESLPIGLENSRWFPEVRKKEKILAKLNDPREYRNLVYMSHNIATNPDERLRLYQLYQNEPWVTSKSSGGFDQYLDNIYNHKFVICPEGNGIDTHRTWECLYVGTIPIEKRNLNNRFYTDLPICFVDNWEDLTPEFLESEFIRIKSGKWNMEKLTFEYWKNRIRK